jgi:hypothetical protein
MMPASQVFEVVAIPKLGPPTECVLGTYKTHAAAAAHALEVDMVQWDDVLVRKTATPAPRKRLLKWR